MTPRGHRATSATRLATATLVALTAGSIGCNDDASRTKPVASASAAAPIPTELETLRATRGAEPLAIRSALAFGKVGSKVSLRLSSQKEDCSAVRGDRSHPDTVVELALDPTLRPNGEIVWTAVSPKLSGRDATIEASRVDVHAADVESEVRAELDVELRPAGGDRTPVRLEGILQARPCGRVGHAPPPPRAQKDLHVTISGRTFNMRAAVLSVEGPDEFSITVASAPRGCGMTDAVGDIELKLTAKGDPARVTGAYLYGELIEGEIRVEPAGDALRIDIADPGEASTRVTMKGNYEHDGLAVKLDGYATAVVCLP